MSITSGFNEMRLGKFLNAPGVGGETYLTRSIQMKQHDALAEFLDLGCDPRAPNAAGETPLFLALRLKDAEALKIMLAKDETLAFIKKDGISFKQHAIRAGLLDVARRAAIIERHREIMAMAMNGRAF